MEIQEPFDQVNEKTLEFEILTRALDNINNNNLIRRYRAIRQISGSINNDDGLLDWLIDNHNGFLEDVSEKLRMKIKDEKDGVMINEAKRSLELIEPYLSTQKPVVSGNLICKNCQGAVQPGWKYCPECGKDLQQKYCTKCGNKLDSSWNICSRCGTRSS